MYTALIILHAITCVLLIGVVLIQSSKGAGLSGVFAADGGDSFMGAGTGNFLTKLTSVLAVIFMITASSLAFMSVKRQRSVMAKTPAVSDAQKQAFQKQIAQKMQEIKEQSDAADSEFTKEVANKEAAPTVDEVSASTAVPEVKTPEVVTDVAVEEEKAAVQAQVKAMEEEQDAVVSQVAAPEKDTSVSVSQEKEIEAALAKAKAKQEATEVEVPAVAAE